MLSGPAQAVVLSASLMSFGALSAIPSAIAQFPNNLFLLVLPLGLCCLIPKLHPPDLQQPNVYEVLLEVAGPWVGYAAAWHAYHGFWDGQGITIGILGFIVTSPIVILLLRQANTPSEPPDAGL